MVRDIYNIEGRFIRAIELCRAELSKSNYAVIKNYVNFNFARGSSKNNIIKLLTFPRRACGMIDKTITEIDEDDLIKILMELNAMPISISTRSGYIISLKLFFNWALRNRKRKLEKLQALLKRKTPCEVRHPKFLIEKPHLEAIFRVTENEEVKDICAVLQESAGRIGEILNLAGQDIEEHPNGVILHLDGKTGKREVLIIENADRLRKRVNAGGYIFSMNYAAFKKHLNQIKKKLGWPELYPHQFRKSRGTFLLERTTEQIVKKILGHTPDSKALKNYSFVRKTSVNDEILRIHKESYPDVVQIDPDIADNLVIHRRAFDVEPAWITQAYLPGQLSLSRSLSSSALSRKYNLSAGVVPLMPRSSAMSMRRFRSY